MTCHVNNSVDIYQHECRGSDTRLNNYQCVNETAANSLWTKRLKPSLQILQNAHQHIDKSTLIITPPPHSPMLGTTSQH